MKKQTNLFLIALLILSSNFNAKAMEDPQKNQFQSLSVQDLLDQGKELELKEGHLDLSSQGLTSLDGLQNFLDAENVFILTIADNNLTSLPEGILNNYINLVTLYAENNKITKIPKNLFKNTPYIKWINFNNNNILTIAPELLIQCPRLQTFALDHNPISDLSAEAIEIIKKNHIYIGKLLHHLDEIPYFSAGELIKKLRKEGRLEEILVKKNFEGKATASIDLSDRSLTDISDLAEALPESLELNITAIDASNNYIAQIPFECLKKYSNLEDLDLSFNLIESLLREEQTIASGFHNLPKLDQLNLSNNYITTIPRKTFQGLKKLYSLDLSNNKIHEIKKGALALHLPDLYFCYLNNNKLNYFIETWPKNAQLLRLDLSNNNLGSANKALCPISTNIEFFPQNPQPLKLIAAHKIAEKLKNQHPKEELSDLLGLCPDIHSLLIQTGYPKNPVQDAQAITTILNNASCFPIDLPDKKLIPSKALCELWLMATTSHITAFAQEEIESLIRINMDDKIIPLMATSTSRLRFVFEILSEKNPIFKKICEEKRSKSNEFIKNTSLKNLVSLEFDILLKLSAFTLANTSQESITQKVATAIAIKCVLIQHEKYLPEIIESAEAGNEMSQKDKATLIEMFSSMGDEEWEALLQHASPELLKILLTLRGSINKTK